MQPRKAHCNIDRLLASAVVDTQLNNTYILAASVRTAIATIYPNQGRILKCGTWTKSLEERFKMDTGYGVKRQEEWWIRGRGTVKVKKGGGGLQKHSISDSNVYWTVHHCNSWRIKEPTWCHLLFYFTSYVLNMFRTLIYPSSGACDCVVELPHRLSGSQFVVCWRFGAAGFEWSSFCRMKHNKLVFHSSNLPLCLFCKY